MPYRFLREPPFRQHSPTEYCPVVQPVLQHVERAVLLAQHVPLHTAKRNALYAPVPRMSSKVP